MNRLARIREQMAAHGLDSMLITDPLNRRYLSGFSGSAGWLLITADRAIAVVDFRYFERAAHEAPDWEQARVSGTYEEALAAAAAAAGVRRLGIEGDHVTVGLDGRLGEQMPDVERVPVEGWVLSQRAVKDESEIGAIRAAVACADGAFAHLADTLRPGMTERQVSWELESWMRQHGASAPSFPIIVAAGPNGAMPHATAGDRPIAKGEAIVMDLGAVVDGYCSDLTRTVCIGQADARYREVWELVLQAQEQVEEQLRPGMTGREADAIARDLFAAAGCAEQFGHGLGHGVGLAIHEAPRLSSMAGDTTLEPGMVFTIEPGLYIPGWGGVRIEDMAVMRDKDAEVLTRAPKIATI